MSSSEAQKEIDDVGTEVEQDGEEKDLDSSLIEDEEESSEADEEEDDESEDEEEQTDGEGEAEEEEEEEAGEGDEGVSEEEDTEDEDSDEDEEDGDAEEEEDGDAEEEEQGEESANSDVSSGDENCDRCPICLNRLRKQDIGTPESCDHCFCLECIQEWAKNVNTCPVDRHVFRIILARHAGEEKIFKQFPVEDRQQEAEEAEGDPTFCEVCGQSNREDRLLLCDRCDLGYHCDCLDPPLASVPVHEWFCPDCQQSRNRVQLEPHPLGRQIARTRISERVRRMIAEARAERAERRRRVAAMIEAQEAAEDEGVSPGPSTSETATPTATTAKKRAARKKRTGQKKKTRKRKTMKKRKTKRKTKGKKTKTRRKRKTKGKGKRKVKKRRTKSVSATSSAASSAALARTAVSRVTSVKGRIADKLGLSKPPRGRSIPMQKMAPTRQEGSAKSSMDYGTSTFSILGSKDELYLFADQEGEERQPVSRPAVSSETLLSRSAKYSHKPLSFSSAKKKIVVSQAPAVSLTPAVAAGTGFDLLGSIMQNQDLLHKGSKHITINRDGTLSAAKPSTVLQMSSRPTSTGTLHTPSSDGGNSSQDLNSQVLANPSSVKKSTGSRSPSKLMPSRSVSFSNGSRSDQTGPCPADFDSVVSEFAAAASSDEELLAECDVPPLLKKEKLDSGEYSYSQSITTPLPSEANGANSYVNAVPIECTQDFHISKSGADCGNKKANDYGEDIYSESGSSTDISLENNDGTYADTSVPEQEHKPLSSSGTSLRGTDQNVGSNISRDTGHSGSDSISTASRNGPDSLHTMEEHPGVNLEADAAFSNNARLNSEDDGRNNSVGFSTSTNPQGNLRNFAAVTGDLNSAPDDSSVGIMKRNFDLLVSTSSNLAGYESGEENVNMLAHNPIGREEGEASDSHDEGEARELEDRNRLGDDQEEGEIADEEERDRWTVGRSTCEEDHEDSGGLDVNAIHVEEMEIGTFRKRSMSQSDDNNEGSKKMKKDDGTPEDGQADQDNEEEKNEDDSNHEKPKSHFFSLSSLLANLKSNDFDGKQDTDQRQEGSQMNKDGKESRNEEEETREREDSAATSISILDFIGDASAKKFGLQTESRSAGRMDHSQYRGHTNFNGGDGFSYRDSRPNGDGRRSYRQGGWRGGDADEDKKTFYNRSFDRRRGQWEEEERDRQRSRPRDNRSVTQRSGSQKHHDREREKGRKERRRDESRDRSRRSRSSSESPERRGEKRRSGRDHEEKRKQSKRGKKSRWNREDKGSDKSADEEKGEHNEDEVKKRNGNAILPRAVTDEYPLTVESDKHPQSSEVYTPHQYPPRMAAFPYPRAPVPPAPHPHVHPHANHPHPNYPHVPHPGVPFNHSATHGQQPYSQPPPGQPPSQAAGYSAFYPPPPPHPSGIAPRAPPPPPHRYPHPVFTGGARYPSQSGQVTAAIVHPNTHMAATVQPHSNFPGYSQPQVVTHPYPQPVPRPGFQHRPTVPSTAPPIAFTPAAAVSSYPPQQPQSVAATPVVHRYNYPTGVKQEPVVTHSQDAASAKPESGTSASVPSNPSAQPESQRSREAVKESSPKDVRPARTSYRISSPTAPIKGVTTYDKVDSSILLNEVKKGFRQLVEDAVRSALKSAWSSKKITKDEYKDIFKRAVEKVCGSKETVIHQEKIQALINAYVVKTRKTRKT